MAQRKPSKAAEDHGPPQGKIHVDGWGDILITPIDANAVRVEVYADHPTARVERNTWRLWAEVRAGHAPAHLNWYGAAATGRWSHHGGKPRSPRSLSGAGFRSAWGAITDALERDVIPLVRFWMDQHPDVMRRARAAHLRGRIAVLERDETTLLDRARQLRLQIVELRREIEEATA